MGVQRTNVSSSIANAHASQQAAAGCEFQAHPEHDSYHTLIVGDVAGSDVSQQESTEPSDNINESTIHRLSPVHLDLNTSTQLPTGAIINTHRIYHPKVGKTATLVTANQPNSNNQAATHVAQAQVGVGHVAC